MDPLKDLEVEQEKLNLESTAQKQDDDNPPIGALVSDDPAGFVEDVVESRVLSKEPSVPSFVLDISGDKSLRPAEESTPGASVPESHYDSDSSEEVILFKGRDLSRRDLSRRNRSSAEPSQPVSDQQDNSPRDTLELREIDLELRLVEKSIQKDSDTAAHKNTQPHAHETTVRVDDHIRLSTSAKHGRSRRGASISITSDEDAAIIADYIANMQDDAGEDGDDGDGRPGIGSHGFNILRDLGGTDSDAVPGEISSGENSSNGSLDDDLDEEDQGRPSELEDERIARILAKQEELGLGGDEILLFDDAGSDYGEDAGQPAPRATPRRKNKGSLKPAGILQEKGQYPSASQMADAFDDLDLMDWHRPSLNNFKKGPKNFDISDSELEEAMNIAWQKDRLKKAEKKKAREELRSQGLLGKKVNPDDLRVKYPGGMSIDDLANELESFLTGTQQQ